MVQQVRLGQLRGSHSIAQLSDICIAFKSTLMTQTATSAPAHPQEPLHRRDRSGRCPGNILARPVVCSKSNWRC